MKPVPFVPNTDDDLHCLQSAYLMIAKYFKPDFDIDWEDWSVITGYEENKGTWASSALIWFIENGFDVIHISLFDYEDFVINGGEYLVREFGKEVGNWQIAHTNMEKEVAKVKELLPLKIIQKREPTIDDIKHFLEKGYLIRCLVNAKKLNGKQGYFGHAVVVSDFDNDSFIIQDPGLPPMPNRKVSFEKFESAWADPNKQAKELDAIKISGDF